MVKAPGDYRWSSYRVNAHGLKNSWITPHKLYMALGETGEVRQTTYRALFQEHVDAESLQLIRESTRQNTIIGDGRFQDEIQAMLKRRVVKHGHGGDRKPERATVEPVQRVARRRTTGADFLCAMVGHRFQGGLARPIVFACDPRSKTGLPGDRGRFGHLVPDVAGELTGALEVGVVRSAGIDRLAREAVGIVAFAGELADHVET